MRRCPYCAEPIQGAAVRCGHCGGVLDGAAGSSARASVAPRVARAPRLLALAFLGVVALAVAGAALARPLLERLRAGGCEPTNVVEWHAAMHDGCLQPSYVCQHMTTANMLADPEVARSLRGHDPAELSDMVGRMRRTFGCAPERGAVLRGDPDVLPTPPGFVDQDAPREL